MKDSSGFNIHKELNKEVVHLYCTAKTYLYLQRNWPVSEAGDPDIFNFFVVILQSLWRDIVVSIGSLIIDKRRDVANFGWFINRLKEEKRLTVEEHSTLTSELAQLEVEFEPFRRARNKVFAHKDVNVMQRSDPVKVDVDLNRIENLVDSLWSLYNKLSEKTRNTFVIPPNMGPAGLEQLAYIMREYSNGPYRHICNAMHLYNYHSFTAQLDSIEDKLHVVFKGAEGSISEDIEENKTIQHFNNGQLIGLTILDFYRK